MTEKTDKDYAKDAERGRQAQALLDNALLNECLEQLRAHYTDEWRRTAPDDVQGRERIYLALQVADVFQQNIRTIIGNGKIAQQHLDKLKGKIR